MYTALLKFFYMFNVSLIFLFILYIYSRFENNLVWTKSPKIDVVASIFVNLGRNQKIFKSIKFNNSTIYYIVMRLMINVFNKSKKVVISNAEKH